jgi:uncharacterized protein
MNKKISRLRWPIIIFILALIGFLFMYQTRTFKVDTDLIEYLPQNDSVLTDARYVIQHMPFQDKVVIDISHQKTDKDILIQGAQQIEAALKKSGLFRKVGIDEMQKMFPSLMMHIVKSLPVMFTAKDLENKIKPLLSPQNIKKVLNEDLAQLQNLEGVGQVNFLIYDPLDFKQHVIARFADLAPSKNASIYKGKLISADNRHLLIIAEIAGSGTDISTSEKINILLDNISAELNKNFSPKGYSFTVNPVGAFRAVLDNANSTKKDTERAVTISTIIIALLLLIGFPRPWVGLLALFPSIVGTALAFIVYSLIHNSISILAVGFGGAIISFTVDYGITYLLFLDRPYETYGMKATKEVWSLGLLAMLTTAVSFAFLFISGFPALAQIGEFAALGVVFTYICVHAFFPVVFPVMRPAKRKGFLPLKNLVNRIISSANKYLFYCALAFGLIMLFFAKPDFHVDLNSMNSVSKETLASENLIKNIWGDILNRVYLMIEARDAVELQQKSDRLTAMLEKDMEIGTIGSAFLTSTIFPGEERMKDNFNAWKKFWNPKRINELKRNVRAVSQNIGFTPDAFQQFLNMLGKKDFAWAPMPVDFHSLFSISQNEKNQWLQFIMLSTSKNYKAENFYSKYSSMDVKLFDAELFSTRLGKMLMSGFIKMALIVGIISILVSFLYLLDWQLALISIAPTVFALIATFGTLNILNQPLGIPTIMVTVAVIGMGTDYAIYLVRAFQRYMDENNASLRLVHMSVFLSFATTFAGFGLLAVSSHSLLKSAGLSLGLGIGYSFLGAISIVPPLLKRAYTQSKRSKEKITAGSKEHFKRVMVRYRHMEAYPRFFARFKILFDPMFPKLAEFVKSPKKIIDIGCGYGAPSCWLMELHPQVRIFAFEPDAKRAYIASRAFGPKGAVETASAPLLPAPGSKSDTALLLDIIHYLNDTDLRETLKWINSHLVKNGRLIIRVTIPSRKKFPWERRIENLRVKLLKINAYFRTAEKLKKMVQTSGFKVKLIEPTKENREETWIIADK